MLGGNKVNSMLPVFTDENQYRYQNNIPNQLQLFGNLPAVCDVGLVNYIGNDHMIPSLRMNKPSRETEDISSQQKLQISLNYNVCSDNVDNVASIPASNHVSTIPAPNHVSTGLRLSYDDDEHNSSVTSASGSMTATPSGGLTLGDSIRLVLDRENEEVNRYLKVQEDYMMKGLKEMKERHTASLLAALEKGLNKKLREKDIEIENMNRKNQELVERIKQVSIEAQNWQYRVKYNESVVDVLKSNLQQAMSMGADHGREGFGDSEVEDAASHVNLNNYLCVPAVPGKYTRNNLGLNDNMICKACKTKEVSVLLMPCRHLCLCEECDGSIHLCPLCQVMITGFVPVYLS